jgi:DNA modification methylase
MTKQEYCMGSGSHLLVARNEGRKFLGIELTQEYYKIAEKRIKEVVAE